MTIIYKKSFFLIPVFLMLLLSNAFGQKEKNRVILWDVTASMLGSTNSTAPSYGYNSNTDIDKIVRVALVKIINSFTEDNSTFRILPFRTEIIDNKEVFKCNKEGKIAAINFINTYVIDKKPIGYTNICSAWDQAMSLIDIGKDNIIYLFTDGNQNVDYGKDGRDCLQGVVDKYCKLSKGGDAYTYFVSLNINNNLITDPGCPIKVMNLGDVKRDGIPDIGKKADLIPLNSTLVINLQDKNSQIERFKISGDGVVKKDLKLEIELTIDPSFPLGIKYKIIEIKDGHVDIEFSLDDYTTSTISKLKNISNLSQTASIKLKASDENITFVPSELPVSIRFKKPQKLNIKIN